MKGKEQEKNERTSKVQYSSESSHKWDKPLHTRGYTYSPRISITGLWLEELGFHVTNFKLSMGKFTRKKGGRKHSERFERIVGRGAETEYRY